MYVRSGGGRFHAWLGSGPRAGLRVTFITFITFITYITPATRAEPSEAEYPDVMPGRALTFPADEGSHPAYRTEWWYITGWLSDAEQRPLGFQVTFFRSRPGVDEANPSRFAPKQLLFAHAAISDPSRGELLPAERSARAGFGLAEAAEQTLDVHIDDWSLRKDADVYRARIAAERIAFELEFRATQPPLLQGRSGFSQKGPDPRSASYYYSLPQMSTQGRVVIEGREHTVEGIAWFDHEWSSTIMDEAAAGWDWAGLNLDDGSAVMAFQMRDRSGGEHWAAGTWRARPESSTPRARTFSPDEIDWQPLRMWKSPRTGVAYPVEWRVQLGERVLTLKPLMDDQENDARGSTGTLYWEGAVHAYDEAGKAIGRGYLELTGYGKAGAARM
jgi:predicted secreted hydrolase